MFFNGRKCAIANSLRYKNFHGRIANWYQFTTALPTFPSGTPNSICPLKTQQYRNVGQPCLEWSFLPMTMGSQSQLGGNWNTPGSSLFLSSDTSPFRSIPLSPRKNRETVNKRPGTDPKKGKRKKKNTRDRYSAAAKARRGSRRWKRGSGRMIAGEKDGAIEPGQREKTRRQWGTPH